MTDEERKILDEQADEVMKEFYDFDEALPDPGDGGGQPLLPAGNYHFQVVKMLRGRQEKGKCAGAKSVELTIKVSDELKSVGSDCPISWRVASVSLV